MGKPVSPRVQFAIGHRLLSIQDGNGLGMLGHLRFQEFMEALVAPIGGWGLIPLRQQLPAFGFRQYIEARQRSARCTLQRSYQPLQRGVHERANTLRINRRLHLGDQYESFAQIAHRKGEWIVGAVFATQILDPGRRLPLGGRLDLGAVTVVQDCGKQRCRRRHRTAALGQGQRRVLMPQQLRELRVDMPNALLRALVPDPDADRQGVDERP